MGMGRSGTSAVAGALYHLGLHMGDDFVAPNHTSPAGFFEDQSFKRLHWLCQHGELGSSDLVWRKAYEAALDRFSSHPVWGMKDPRLADEDVFWPVVDLIARNVTGDIRLVVCERSGRGVRGSYARAYDAPLTETWGWYIRRRRSLDRILKVWPHLAHRVEFESLSANPTGVVARLQAFVWPDDHPIPARKRAVEFLNRGGKA